MQEEAKKYEPEFPNELYREWYRLYDIPVLSRGKPWHFKYLTVNHICHPLAESNGKLLELLRAVKAKGGDQKAKLFQFLNKIGARALRIQLGRVLEMAESSPDKAAYERKIVERFGGQKEFEFIIPPPPLPETKEAANCLTVAAVDRPGAGRRSGDMETPGVPRCARSSPGEELSLT